jgi:hypothetical protein
MPEARDSLPVTDTPPEIDPRKVRIGLAIVGVVFVAAVVLFFVADDAVGRAIFFAVAAACLFQMWRLVRWIRRSGPAAPTA